MIDKVYLEGLKWKSVKAKEIKDENGEKKFVYEPVERNLETQDIIAMKDYSNHYVIVTSDGRKYNINKLKLEQGIRLKKEVTNALS